MTSKASQIPESTPKDRLADSGCNGALKINNMHVLMVDDTIDNQILLNRYLTKDGATVYFANAGSEAVEKAMSLEHDLVLMDIQMPKMDGYQAVKALQSRAYKKPIVALTAHALVEERRRTAAAGFAAHLTKPFNREELIDMLSRLTSENPSHSHA